MHLDEDDAAEARSLNKVGRRRHHTEAFVERLNGPLMRAAFVVGTNHRSLLKTSAVMVDDATIRSLGEVALTNSAFSNTS